MSLRFLRIALITGLTVAMASPAFAASDGTITVGSKKFTESVILGELATLLGREAGYLMRHRRELGGTRVLWDALLVGDVDIYPEYTGTLTYEIFSGERLPNDKALAAALAARGVRMTAPLGFANNYALGMKREAAAHRGIRRISDLARYPELRFGFGEEFLARADGWPGLRRAYGLPQQNVRGLDHDLAYRGIAEGAIDVVDAYTTDAEVAYYDLVLLEDDRRYFPSYDAVFVYRADLAERAPGLREELRRLEGAISAEAMRRMNALVKLESEPEPNVAAAFLFRALDVTIAPDTFGFWRRLLETTLDHLTLVAISLSAAIVMAVPLGMWAYLRPAAGRVILGAVGVVQTIPSLALFVFMIPLLGIGGPPAVMALFLYSLLPIVRNTHAGLAGIPLELRDSAVALGLPRRARLWLVELPMASPSILAGIKTSAVINVGTATLGALIGAGGYGQPILTGIRLNDTGLILQGAVPAAFLALFVEWGFGALERVLVPRGLQLRSRG